jgi:hypothetical protein
MADRRAGPLDRLARLRAMSASELTHRVRYALYCTFERRAHRRGALAPASRLHDALVDDLRRGDWQSRLLDSRAGRRADFFAGSADRDVMRGLFETRFQHERRAAIAAADRVMDGRIEFFGETFSIASGARWNHDPVTGAEWPRRYHRDVPIHGGQRGWGDVKYVWELNRHQFLVDLGRAFFLTGDRKYADALHALVTGWIRDNPYATGVNWSCALEPAFRVFSWLWCYYLCAQHDDERPDDHLLWLTSFYDHGRFLHRHLEHYSSPYNHLIGESTALYMLGVLFPEFDEAQAWRARGREVLETRLATQFYADGGTREQSTFYHHATLGFYVLAAVLARRHGEEFAPQVWQAIERAIDFSAALVDPDGRTPAIGGADDGKPLRMEHLPFWNFRPFQAIGSVLFDRGDLKFVAGRFFEDALWLLGPEGLAHFDAVPSREPHWLSRDLPSSGYYVLRSEWTSRADYVCIDCGEQAGDIRTDAVPNSVHGHADCLSIVLSLGGRPVLVDSGLFCYNGEPAWEGHFRRTAAHSTAQIDGLDQAHHLGKMAWAHSYVARPELWSADRAIAAFMGSHDGYTRRGGDTIHRRVVWLRPGGYVIVYDEFECNREHGLQLHFQFAPGELSLMPPGSASYGDVARIAWTASTALSAVLHSGGDQPAEGWIATSLGVRVPAPRLTLSGRITPGAAALTVFACASGPSALSVVTTDDAGVLKVVAPEFEDDICAPAIARARASMTDGRVAVWRGRKGVDTEAAQIGGTFVTARFT